MELHWDTTWMVTVAWDNGTTRNTPHETKLAAFALARALYRAGYGTGNNTITVVEVRP